MEANFSYARISPILVLRSSRMFLPIENMTNLMQNHERPNSFAWKLVLNNLGLNKLGLNQEANGFLNVPPVIRLTSTQL